jgi:hypothetical protein
MAIDHIVAEVRRVREAYAKQFNYDIHAMWRDLQERQHQSGHTVVSLPPKRTEPVVSGTSARREESPNQGMEPTR